MKENMLAQSFIILFGEKVKQIKDTRMNYILFVLIFNEYINNSLK